MITANREQLTVIEGLTVFNEEIATIENKSEADKLARVAISMFSEQAEQAFLSDEYLFHSLSSFVLKLNPETGALSQWRFGELLHAGGAVGIGYLSTLKDDIRSLSLQVDAAGIAKPPANENPLDPFYEKVSLPIESIIEIKVVE